MWKTEPKAFLDSKTGQVIKHQTLVFNPETGDRYGFLNTEKDAELLAFAFNNGYQLNALGGFSEASWREIEELFDSRKIGLQSNNC